MDADSTSSAAKESDSAAKALCPMDVGSLPQVDNMDTCHDLDGHVNNAAQLKSNEDCSPATEATDCNEPAGIVMTEHAMSCQSVPTSTDVELQSNVGEFSQRMEIGSQEGADDGVVHSEEGCCLTQKGVSEENSATCQSVDENMSGICKTIEDREESEALHSVAQPVTLTSDNDWSVSESNAGGGDFASSATSPANGKHIINIVNFYGHYS